MRGCAEPQHRPGATARCWRGSGTGEDESADEDDDAPEDQGSGEPRGGLDMLADAIGGIDAGSWEEPQDEVHPS